MNPIRTKRFNLFAIGLALSIQLSLPAFSQSIEEAIRLTQANQFPQALQIMEGLYQQNPEDPRVINNLAIIYNRRGVTAQTSNTSDYNSAVNDYRRSIYILNYEWPEGLTKPPEALQNAKGAQSNLELALKNLQIPLADWQWHFKEAKVPYEKRLPNTLGQQD